MKSEDLAVIIVSTFKSVGIDGVTKLINQDRNDTLEEAARCCDFDEEHFYNIMVEDLGKDNLLHAQESEAMREAARICAKAIREVKTK